jgi:hypothetical protein
MTKMNESATVKIFLVKGSPTSIRTAEISNWTGKAIAGPRSQIEDILNREEARKPGVYFLTGVNPESGKDRVYIGEAEVIRNRIKGHLERDFWKTLVFFVSKDENLTKAHIKYLEGKRDPEKWWRQRLIKWLTARLNGGLRRTWLLCFWAQYAFHIGVQQK